MRGLHVILTKKTSQHVTEEAGEINQVTEEVVEEVEEEGYEISAADLEVH